MTVDIANRLVELRKKHGYSQEKLAEMLGLSRQAVSKWERAEASPDTDNLIMLSRLYGVSLDELLSTEAEDEEFVGEDQPGAKEEQKKDEEREAGADTYVDIGFDGVHVVDGPKGDKVHVSWKGVHISEDGKEKVHIGKDGVYIDDEDVRPYVGKRGHVFVNGVDYSEKSYKRSLWARIPVAVVIVIAFVIISFVQGAMYPAWLLLLAIPIVDSLFKAIYYKDIRRFSFPVVAVVAFLVLGLEYGLWHPGWVVFLAIPIWYSLIPHRKGSHNEDDDDDDD